MKTINVIIERANDGTFGAYAENVPGIYGAGDDVKEVKQSIFDGIETMKEIGNFPYQEYEIKYKFDTESLLQYYKGILGNPAFEKITGINQKTGNSFHADYDENKEMTAKVFKTIADPFIGKFSLIKICSGVLKADSTIYNVAKDVEEKISRLYVLRGKEQIEVKELHAGDIGAIGKLDIATGDSIATKAVPVVYDKPSFSVPYTYMRYVTKNKGDDDKIASALAKIVDEDPTIKLVNDSANRQSLIYGIGDQQLEVVVSKLANRYKVDIELLKPRIPYKETIKKKVSVQNKYKKQTGGHGQYGDVHITFEPSDDLEKQYIFEETVFGGAIPKDLLRAIL